MNAYVRHDYLRRMVEVTLYDRGPVGYDSIYRVTDDGRLRRDTIPEGQSDVEPTYVLPVDAFEAIIREGSGIVPPSDATHAALTDAKAVRDRLMSLVESEWQSRQLERR